MIQNEDSQKVILNSYIYGSLFGIDDIPFLTFPFEVESSFETHLLRDTEIQQYLLNEGPENCHDEIKLFLTRLISQRENQLIYKLKNRIDFLLLHFSASIVEIYNVTGHFHYCYEVFQLSVLHRTTANGEMYDLNVNNVFKHINSFDELIDEYSYRSTILWLGQLYYYSRSFSGLNEWGELLLNDTLMLVDDQHQETGEFNLLLSNLFVWCEFNNVVSEMAYLLKKFEKLEKELSENSNPTYAESIRMNIVSSEKFSKNYRAAVAQKLKDHVWVNEISKMQFYIISYISKLFPEVTFSQLEEVVTSLHENMKHKDKIRELHEKSRIAKVLNPFIRYCFVEQQYSELHNIILKFYDKNNFTERVLYITPNSPDGTELLSYEKMILVPHNPYDSIVALTKFRNLALNQFVLLKGVNSTNEIPTGTIGSPNYSYGADFEKSLLEIYDLSQLSKGDFNNNKSFMQFDFNGIPIQPIFLKQVNSSLPKQISFCEKVNYKKITKILFWIGNSYTSIQEFDCVKEICERCGIELTGIKDSKEEFFNEVQNDHDIVWISSHGEHGHYDPFKSKIVLGDDFHIELNEFEHLANPNQTSRRLFFNNVCEGGISAQTGDLINVGFPAFIANSNQDYLSHLWMVHSQIAKIYGVLFMIFVSKGCLPFEAFEKTVLTLISGRLSVLEELSHYSDLEKIAELMESNSNLESVDFSNILNWGSSAYHV